MTFTDSVKEGFDIVNRRWHLILIRIAASMIDLIAFFIIVGIPLFIAIAAAGAEIATANAGEFLSSLERAFTKGYIWVVFLVAASILVYLFLAVFVWMYVASGSMGIIARALEKRKEPFRMKTFFAEAKRHITALANFYFLMAALVVGVFFALGVAATGAAYLCGYLKAANPILGALMEALWGILIMAAGLFAVYAGLAVGAFGAGIVVLDSERAWRAVRKSADFLVSHPRGFWGYCALVTAYGVASFLLFLIGYPFRFIPLLGMVIAVPYELASYALERYLGLSLLGSAFSYYFRNTRVRMPEEGPAQAQAPAGPAATEGAPPPGPPQTPLSDSL